MRVGFFAVGRLKAGPEKDLAARYLDRFEKRGEEWRIIHRTLVVDYSRQTGSSETNVYDHASVALGKRFPDDPLYSVFR